MTDAKVIATGSYLDKISADRLSAEEKFSQFQSKILGLSYDFHAKVIPRMVYDESWETRVKDAAFYRVCGIQDLALNPAGSLGSGARMNVGFSQSTTGYREDFRPLAAVQGAIYVADSVKTAILESYGDEYPLAKSLSLLKRAGSKQLHKIEFTTSSTPYYLIDFEAVCADIGAKYEFPTYFGITQDLNGQWGDLKCPAPIQLMASWLMSSSKDAVGIRFRSTQSADSFNMVFYLRDIQAALNLLKASLMDPPELSELQ